jgi:hypothetical protein
MGPEQISDDSDTPEAKEILAIERTDYFKIGLFLTALILLLAGVYAFFEWDAIHAMKPNEFGDFLAGIFGSLVLLWVVMGFLQQGAELKYSREALLLQAKELKASVEAQQNMGEAAWAGVHLERDARQLGELERVRALQPIFTLTSGGYTGHGDRIQMHFALSNLGRDAVDVSVQILESDLVVSPSSFSSFTERREFVLNVTVDRTAELPDCVLELRYHDLEGNLSERHYQLKKCGDAYSVVNQRGDPPTP